VHTLSDTVVNSARVGFSIHHTVWDPLWGNGRAALVDPQYLGKIIAVPSVMFDNSSPAVHRGSGRLYW